MMTALRENFALLVFEGIAPQEAYALAGYAVENYSTHALEVEVSRLLHEPEVALRIQGLRDAAAARSAVTVESLLGELELVRVQAMQEVTGSPSAAATAIMGKAKIAGLIVDKQRAQVDVTVQALPPLAPEAALLIKAQLELEKF